MEDSVNLIVGTVLTVVAISILWLIYILIPLGFKLLLIRMKIIKEDDERSNMELIGYVIGRMIGKLKSK